MCHFWCVTLTPHYSITDTLHLPGSKACVCPQNVQQRVNKGDIVTALEDMPLEYLTGTQYVLGFIQAADRGELPCGWLLSVCFAETNDWKNVEDLNTANDPVYAIILDTAAKLSAKQEHLEHSDGLARTISFVRLEEFETWYDIDPRGHGTVIAGMDAARNLQLTSIRANFLEDLGRYVSNNGQFT